MLTRAWIAGLIDSDGGRFSYSYNSANQIGLLINPENERTTFGYDNAGRQVFKKMANGTRTSFLYNDANRTQTVANLDSTEAYISRFDYQYDAAGNRTCVLEITGDRTTWSYDKTDQLLSEHRTGARDYSHTFMYDSVGNRILKNEDSSRTTFTFDVANQLQTACDTSGTTSFTFDANGNQLVTVTPTLSRTTNAWDYENLTTTVELGSGITATYSWDADGHRVAKEGDGVETKIIWDEENIIQETDASNATKVTYTLELQAYGNVISESRKFGALWLPSYYHFDALGATRNLSDGAEAITDSWLYDAWGNTVSKSGTSLSPFLWGGQVQYYNDSETDRFTIRARIYCPTVSRWLSEDPLGFVDSPNLFTYAALNPVNELDPSGLSVFCGNECNERLCLIEFTDATFLAEDTHPDEIASLVDWGTWFITGGRWVSGLINAGLCVYGAPSRCLMAVISALGSRDPVERKAAREAMHSFGSLFAKTQGATSTLRPS